MNTFLKSFGQKSILIAVVIATPLLLLACRQGPKWLEDASLSTLVDVEGNSIIRASVDLKLGNTQLPTVTLPIYHPHDFELLLGQVQIIGHTGAINVDLNLDNAFGLDYGDGTLLDGTPIPMAGRSKGPSRPKSAQVQSHDTSSSLSLSGSSRSGSDSVKITKVGDPMGSLSSISEGKLDIDQEKKGAREKKNIYTAGIPHKTVILGSMDPSMDPETIRKILIKNLPQFRYCYQRELNRTSHSFDGVIHLNFIIGASGHVSKAAILSPPKKLPLPVRQCIVNVVKGIKFPEPLGKGVVEVNQPLNFYLSESMAMDPETIRKILIKNLPQFRYCYQRELNRTSHSFDGVIHLNFIIGASGHVSKAAILSPPKKLPLQIRKCVVNVVKGIKFPEPLGKGVVEVNQPLNFYLNES